MRNMKNVSQDMWATCSPKKERNDPSDLFMFLRTTSESTFCRKSSLSSHEACFIRSALKSTLSNVIKAEVVMVYCYTG